MEQDNWIPTVYHNSTKCQNYIDTSDTDALAANLAGGFLAGLEEQVALQSEVKKQYDCGETSYTTINEYGQRCHYKIYCNKCDDCKERLAKRATERIKSRIGKLINADDNLALSFVGNVSEDEIGALQKRIQRDKKSRYVRFFNGVGYDFFVVSERSYGQIVSEFDYDVFSAKAIAKQSNKRITGSLYSTKSGKSGDKKSVDTYKLSLTKFYAKDGTPETSEAIYEAAGEIKPDKPVYSRNEHQAEITNLNARIATSLNARGIAYTAVGYVKLVRDSDRALYNELICPNKTIYDDCSSISSYLDKEDTQMSLFEPQDPGPSADIGLSWGEILEIEALIRQ